MSIRGHRVNSLELGDARCFFTNSICNQWMFEHGKFDSLNETGGGLCSFSFRELTDLVKRLKESKTNLDLVQGLSEDVAFMQSNGCEYLDYYFY